MVYYAPSLLNSIPGITAGISYAKRGVFNCSGAIAGLNFGENTGVPFLEVQKNLEILNHETEHNGQIAIAEQVHGRDVSIINKSGYYPGIDGIITSESDLMIGIKIADCAALLFSDPSSGIIAAVHAGWRGAAAGIVPHTLQKLKQLGAEFKNISVYISPCISLQNFEIGEEVADQFPPQFIDRSIGSKPHLNLKHFLVKQLEDADIQSNNIKADSRCTIDDSSFYSFRRERDKAGRMLAFIKQSFK